MSSAQSMQSVVKRNKKIPCIDNFNGLMLNLNLCSISPSFDYSIQNNLNNCYEQNYVPKTANKSKYPVKYGQELVQVNFNCSDQSKQKTASNLKQTCHENFGKLYSTSVVNSTFHKHHQNNEQQKNDEACLKLLKIENQQLRSQINEKEYTNNQLRESLSKQNDEIQYLKAQILELYQKQTNQNAQILLFEQLKLKFDVLDKEYKKIIEEKEQFFQNLIEKNSNNVLQNQCRELITKKTKSIENIKQQLSNYSNQQNNNSFSDESNVTTDISFLFNEKSEILGKTEKYLSIQSNILSCKIQNQLPTTNNKIIKDIINLSNQYSLQQIKNKQLESFIQRKIKIFHPPLPIALILGKSGVGKTRLLEQLFNLSNIKEFVPILHADLDCYFVDTMGFDFKSNIDKREHQILLFKKLFKQYPNKVANIFIVVNFERTDMMKNKIMEVNRYFKKFQDKISFIITNFDLSENVEEDKQHLQEKLSFYKNQVLIFTGKTSTQQQIIESLKPVLVKQNENQVYPFDLKDTMFEEEDENETNEMLNRLNEQFRH